MGEARCISWCRLRWRHSARPIALNLTAEDGQQLGITHTEVAHSLGELPGLADGELPRGGRAASDESAVTPARLEQTGQFQFSVGASHRVDGQTEIRGQPPHRGQSNGRLQTTALDEGRNLHPNLLKGRDRGIRIQYQKVHPTFVSAIVAIGKIHRPNH